MDKFLINHHQLMYQINVLIINYLKFHQMIRKHIILSPLLLTINFDKTELTMVVIALIHIWCGE